MVDLKIPEMDGIGWVNSCKIYSSNAEKKTAKTMPIIAMSANAFDEDVEKSRASGMNAYLAKLIEPERLFRILYDILKERDVE